MSMFRRRLLIHQKTNKKEYIKFADPEVERICIENWSSDGIGLTVEDAEKVTTLSNKFNRNKLIHSFNEFEKFVNVTSIGTVDINDDTTTFYNTSLKEIKLPLTLININNITFADSTNLVSINLNHVKKIGKQAFHNCSLENISLNLPNLTYLGEGAFNSTDILEILDLGSVSSIGGGDNNVVNSHFYNCKKLKKVILSKNITTLKNYSFAQCISLIDFTWDKYSIRSIGRRAFEACLCEIEIDLPNLESLELGAFYNSGITKIINLGNITEFSKTDTNYVNGTHDQGLHGKS